MIDSFMGLPFGNSYFLPGQGESSGADSDYMNVYFQQSFNKMLSDLTGDGGEQSEAFSDSGDSFALNYGNQFSTNSPLYSGGQEVSTPWQSASAIIPGLDQTGTLFWKMQACSSLIGKQIEYDSDSSAGLNAGKVEKVVIEDGVPFLLVNSKKVALENVKSVA